VPAGMADGLKSVAALQTAISRVVVDRSVLWSGVVQVQVGPKWAGGSCLGGAM
jgi:hypothetical protein